MAIEKSGAWTYSGLLALFRSLLNGKNHLDPLHLIIDGLHRCDQSLQKLLRDLFAIAGGERLPQPLKIALFSEKEENDGVQRVLQKYARLCLPEVVLAGDVSVSLSVPPTTPDLAFRVMRDHPHLTKSPLDLELHAALGWCKNKTEVSLTLQAVSSHKIGSLHSQKTLTSLIRSLPPSVFDSITSKFGSLQDWARVALGWIWYAKRPLTAHELATAVILTSANGDLNTSFDPKSPSAEVAADLVSVDIAADIEASFSPFVSVQNGGLVFSNDHIRALFLMLIENDRARPQTTTHQKPNDNDPGDAETSMEPKAKAKAVIPGDADITRLLLKYLSWSRFADPVEEALKKTEFVNPRGPLFNLTTYAVCFLPFHYRAVEHTPEILELARPNLVPLWSRLSSKLNPTAAAPNIHATTPFLLAAKLGLAGIVQNLQGSASTEERNATRPSTSPVRVATKISWTSC